MSHHQGPHPWECFYEDAFARVAIVQNPALKGARLSNKDLSEDRLQPGDRLMREKFQAFSLRTHDLVKSLKYQLKAGDKILFQGYDNRQFFFLLYVVRDLSYNSGN